MQELAPQYSLGMIFSNQRGQYIAEVDVAIKDEAGHQVVATNSDGPLLLVDLPEGQYTTFDGQTQHRRVNIPDEGRRQVVMRWRTPDEQL